MNSLARNYDVVLYEKKVGVLSCHHNVSSFAFDPEYIADAYRDVLGLAFEQNLTARFASNVRLPVWFSNLLPEGVLRDWIAEERGVSRVREVELLAQVGGDLPGAVKVLPSDSAANDVPGTSVFPEDMPRVERGGWRFSLAGVGLKFSMLKDFDRFTCPASGAGGDWIVKLPDRVYPNVPINEFAMMELARQVGIDVPDTVLVHRDEIDDLPKNVWSSGEVYAFAVRRFDRTESRTGIHIEDLAQVRGLYPEHKYHGNFETVASLIYRGVDEFSLIEFVRRLTLNILIGNGDAHLKNWSLIYRDRRRPSLSPAYDIVATGLYAPRGEDHDLGMKFGGDRRFECVRLQTFRRLGQRLRVPVDLAEVADETVGRVLDAWPGVADLLASAPEVREEVASSIERGSVSLRLGRQ